MYFCSTCFHLEWNVLCKSFFACMLALDSFSVKGMKMMSPVQNYGSLKSSADCGPTWTQEEYATFTYKVLGFETTTPFNELNTETLKPPSTLTWFHSLGVLQFWKIMKSQTKGEKTPCSYNCKWVTSLWWPIRDFINTEVQVPLVHNLLCIIVLVNGVSKPSTLL